MTLPAVVASTRRDGPGGQTPARAATPSRARTGTPAPAPRPKVGPTGRGCHPRPVRTPARLTRRGVVASRLAGAAAVLVIAFGVVQGLQPLAPDVVGSRTVTVVPGQTLWSIATAANPTIDPRVTVEALRRLNGLEDSSVIEPGRELSVPVFDDP